MDSFFETIKRFSENSSNADMENLFLRFNSEKGHDEIDKLLQNKWASFSFESECKIEVDSKKIFNNIKKRIVSPKQNAVKQWFIKLLPYAAILIVGILTTWFILSEKNSGTKIPGPVKNSYTSVITENGQRTKVVLPDSSIVWLNSGTTLSYPDDFLSNCRKVIVSGQAFFQVAHKNNFPFEVQTNGLSLKVLGTKFDVNAYPELGEIAVVLETGKVELYHRNYESFRYTMKPGELATFSSIDSSMHISNVDPKIYSSWKDGKLIFRNTPMRTVIEKLERWYNINVEVKDIEVYNSIFNGTIKNESYEEIFRLIEIACPIKCRFVHNYEKEAKPEIIISKK
jgi:ferric-dicitrate binding protein FerR (iron transport regulator)